VRSGQPLPPFCAAVVTVRVRVWTPPPQLFEQVDQPLQPLTLQSVGLGSGTQALSAPPRQLSPALQQALPQERSPEGQTQAPPLPQTWPRAQRPSSPLQVQSGPLQVRHSPEQAVVQQRPSRQAPDSHSVPLPQARPATFFSQRPPRQVRPPPQEVSSGRGLQVQPEAAVHCMQLPAQPPAQHFPPTQAPDWQSRSSTQSPPFGWRADGPQLPSPQTRAGAQASVLFWQTPPGLQVRRVRAWSSLQVAGPQAVPARSRWQPPAPSQPFEHWSSRHSPAGSAPPGGTWVQVPSLPGRLQATQLPPQGRSQQRPWAQTPLVQSASLLQRAPPSRLPQSPAVQTRPAAHWASLPQTDAQRSSAQPRNGAQERGGATWHRPSWQVPGCVSVFPSGSQLGGWQTVPGA
jgi:hypothetical protein